MTRLLGLILAVYLAETAVEFGLDFLNRRHLRKYGSVVPAEFEGQIDPALLAKTRDYVLEKSWWGMVTSAFSLALLVVFLFGGVLDLFNSWIAARHWPFIPSGLCFFLVLAWAKTLLEAPFHLVQTFHIENRYGFNTMDFKLWFADFIKSLLLSSILLATLISAGLWLVRTFPGNWWLWVWGFFFAFSLFLLYVSPYILEPLFNKFTPLQDEDLLTEIRRMLDRTGIRVGRLFQMDASKRSKHTNAYFSGIGRVKRIVLFDTLLQNLSRPELLAVLAHEAGHWKKKHLLKTLAATEAIALGVFVLAFRILPTEILTRLFQLQADTFYAKVILLGFLLSLAAFPLGFVSNYFSRKHEREADRFAGALTGDPRSMAGALVKLSKDNLSNLHPHPLYAAFYYSHPPVVQRIREIKSSVTTEMG